MPALKQQSTWMSETEYLEFERASDTKHEYFAGEVFAMSGASEAYNLISVNLITSLKTQLKGKSCKVYGSDMRVKIEATRLYTYPDVSVVCDKAEFADKIFDTLTNPTILIEILSPSTERYDRGKKFQDYRELTSLREYLLVAQSSPRIEHYLLMDDGKWTLTDTKGIDASLILPSINCTLSLSDVYDLVEFEDDASRKEE